MAAFDLNSFPVHLGLGAGAVVEPQFTGDMQWYGDYAQRHLSDGAEGRLVSMHTFTQSWEMWEMHPSGSEIVICTGGSLTIIQEQNDGTALRVELQPGQYAVNAPGVWHTADVSDQATAIFITAGMGTEHRAR